jgi:uncharacterized cysteine cluster protein YcgN (CxxCxxCC family)
MTLENKPFWESKSLSEMTPEEWEALCDRCGQCCLHKTEDDETDEVYFTCIACRLLELENCSCTDYLNRMAQVAECLKIRPVNFKQMHLLPESCAYRRLSVGKSLLWWHPLISNDPETVHQAEISIRGKAISEENVHPDEFAAYIMTR